jgi:hypothetical protein
MIRRQRERVCMEVVRVCMEVVREIRKRAPKDTGNLAYNSIRYEWKGNKFIIYVDENIAPYMPFTNEPWIHERWNGKPNPNEAWWQYATWIAVRYLIYRLKGTLK